MHSQDINRAAETLCAMAAIPCLRGAGPLFDIDDSLEPAGWYREDQSADFEINQLWVMVPDAPDLTECLKAVHAALAEARGELQRMVEWETSKEGALCHLPGWSSIYSPRLAALQVVA
ncbi:MAG: hypothetical protein ACR2NR_14360 [Solirubrobacteraceae bacterium]